MAHPTGANPENAEAADVLALPQAPDAIEIRHLRSFVAVADELNFGRAAARLYLSQPALSRQIRGLERLVGCDLLRRSTHRVELTLAGEALRDRARSLLRDLDEAVTVTRSVGGELMARIARHWESFAEVSAADLEELRTAFEALHSQFVPPPGIRAQPVNASGIPGLLLTPQSQETQSQENGTVLFLHGGGHIAGSAFGYQPLAAALADAAGAGVVIPDYGLAPEFPFPAAVEDAVRAYRWVLDRGTPATRVTVAGDSSGGGLAMSLLLRLRQQGLPMPGGAMLFCPWVDLELRNQHSHELDKFRAAAASLYLGGHRADDPLVSPLTADLTGLPPLLVQAATGDPLLEESRELVDHAADCGVEAHFELFPVDTHDFHIFWSFLPEAAQAIRQAGSFARDTATAGAAQLG